MPMLHGHATVLILTIRCDLVAILFARLFSCLINLPFSLMTCLWRTDLYAFIVVGDVRVPLNLYTAGSSQSYSGDQSDILFQVNHGLRY